MKESKHTDHVVVVLNRDMMDEETFRKARAEHKDLLKQRDALKEALKACFDQLVRIGAAPNTDQVQSHFDHESVYATDLARAALAQVESEVGK